MILAEVFGETLTSQRMNLYAADLEQFSKPKLAIGFSRARRELKFFPKLAELLAFVGGIEKERLELEADAKFEWLRLNIDKACFTYYPTSGRTLSREWMRQFEPRFAYAIRSAGGPKSLDECFQSNRPTDAVFAKQRFIEAYLRYDAAVDLGVDQLPPGPVRALLKATRPTVSDKYKQLAAPAEKVGTDAELAEDSRQTYEAMRESRQRANAAAETPYTKAQKAMPQPLSESEREQRRQLLKQQAEGIKA